MEKYRKELRRIMRAYDCGAMNRGEADSLILSALMKCLTEMGVITFPSRVATREDILALQPIPPGKVLVGISVTSDGVTLDGTGPEIRSNYSTK